MNDSAIKSNMPGSRKDRLAVCADARDIEMRESDRQVACRNAQVVLSAFEVLGGKVSLSSREQARHLIDRIGSCRRVQVDFSGVRSVGKAFADELFCVFPQSRPGLDLRICHAAPAVMKAVLAAQQKALRPNPAAKAFRIKA